MTIESDVRRTCERAAKIASQLRTMEGQLHRIIADLEAVERDRAAIRREPLPLPPEGFVPPTINQGNVLAAGLTEGYVIYALVDLEDPEAVRYVGKTNTPETRFRAHQTGGSALVMGWFRELKHRGRTPAMLLIEQCRSASHADEREFHWIGHYRDRGLADLNQQIPVRTRRRVA